MALLVRLCFLCLLSSARVAVQEWGVGRLRGSGGQEGRCGRVEGSGEEAKAGVVMLEPDLVTGEPEPSHLRLQLVPVRAEDEFFRGRVSLTLWIHEASSSLRLMWESEPESPGVERQPAGAGGVGAGAAEPGGRLRPLPLAARHQERPLLQG